MSWFSVAQRLSCKLDESRSHEVAEHLADANANGESVTPQDVGPIALLVGRAKAKQAKRELPNIVAGLPIALLCTIAYENAYILHVEGRDLTQDIPIPFNDSGAALIHSLAERAWIVYIPLGLYTGWRAIQRFRTGPRLLPTVLIASLLALIGRTFWSISATGTVFRTNANNGELYLDAGSYQSFLIALLSILLPLTFVAVDGSLRLRNRRQRSSNNPMLKPSSSSSERPAVADRDVQTVSAPLSDPWAVATIVLFGAVLIPILSSIVAIPFVLVTWMASSFSRTQKLIATASGLAGLLPVTHVIFPDEQPRLVVYSLLILLAVQIGVWIWMAVTVARKSNTSNPTKADHDPDQFSAITSR